MRRANRSGFVFLSALSEMRGEGSLERSQAPLATDTIDASVSRSMFMPVRAVLA